MKKVLIVDFNGTAPTYTYYFAMGLMDNGLDVSILGTEDTSFTAIHPVKINYVGMHSSNKLFNYIMNWLNLLRKAKKYDAIHIQWLPMLKFSSIELSLIKALKKRNSNIFYTVHNFFPHNSEIVEVNSRYLRLYGILENLVIHAKSTAQKIQKEVGPKRMIKIEHGYFYSEFRAEKNVEKTFDIAMLGNVLPYKGVEDAIEVVEVLRQMNLNVKLLIAGKCSPGYLLVLKNLIEEKGLKTHIILDIGFLTVEKLMHYYNTTTLSIMPYKEIEQSGVLHTSLGMGVPIVGYALGGIAETITNDREGYLVPKDDLEKLAKAVERGLKNREIWSANIKKVQTENIWYKNASILKEAYFK